MTDESPLIERAFFLRVWIARDISASFRIALIGPGFVDDGRGAGYNQENEGTNIING